MKLAYPAIFYRDEETGAFAVEVPDLPGCSTGGDNLAEAILMAVDAASGWVLDELERSRPIPSASSMDQIIPDDGGFVSMIVLDMDSYAEKYGKKTILKDIEIPAWLNTFAEFQNINISKVLQEELAKMYARKIEDDDDEFCLQLYYKSLADEDDDEGMTWEEYAREIGIKDDEIEAESKEMYRMVLHIALDDKIGKISSDTKYRRSDFAKAVSAMAKIIVGKREVIAEFPDEDLKNRYRIFSGKYLLENVVGAHFTS